MRFLWIEAENLWCPTPPAPRHGTRAYPPNRCLDTKYWGSTASRNGPRFAAYRIRESHSPWTPEEIPHRWARVSCSCVCHQEVWGIPLREAVHTVNGLSTAVVPLLRQAEESSTDTLGLAAAEIPVPDWGHTWTRECWGGLLQPMRTAGDRKQVAICLVAGVSLQFSLIPRLLGSILGWWCKETHRNESFWYFSLSDVRHVFVRVTEPSTPLQAFVASECCYSSGLLLFLVALTGVLRAHFQHSFYITTDDVLRKL